MKERNMRMEKSWKFLWGLSLGLALIATGCGEPDYGKKGSSGTKPAGPVNQPVTYVADPPMPIPFEECDKPYEVDVVVTETGVTCEGYDFSDLIEQAKNLVDSRLAEAKCPEGDKCPGPPHNYYTYWGWNCANGAATVSVKSRVLCASKGNADGTKKGINLATQDKKKPLQPPAIDPPDNGKFEHLTFGETIIESLGKGDVSWTVGCGKSKLVEVSYQETNPAAAGLKGGFGNSDTVKEVVKNATDRAKTIYNQFSCEKGCTKQPFAVLYTEWDAPSDDVIVVNVYFTVECKK